MVQVNELKPLLDLYATTVFLCSRPIPFTQFAIVTAHNPMGVINNQLENKKLNNSLQLQINQYEYFEVIGAAPDLQHQELSFAINMPLPQAQELAKKVKQNALFWVEHDNISIEPACLPFASVPMVRFSHLCIQQKKISK